MSDFSDELSKALDGLEPGTRQEWERKVEELFNQVRLQQDAITGPVVPRDLSHLTMSEMVELLKMLRTAAEFTKEPPSPVNIVARRLFAVVNEKVGETSPKIQRLLEEEALLAEARDAAREVYKQYLREKSRFGKPVVYWGAALALYLVSIAVGSLVVAVVGGVIALWAFGRSTLCRTSRAAVYMRVADALDGLRRGRQDH